MQRYRIVHRDTGEIWEVEAGSAEKARQVIGWELGTCRVFLAPKDSDVELKPPKIATQISLPVPGSGYICKDCSVTLMRCENWLWWQCPSCELLFHSEEQQYYHPDDLEGI